MEDPPHTKPHSTLHVSIRDSNPGKTQCFSLSPLENPNIFWMSPSNVNGTPVSRLPVPCQGVCSTIVVGIRSAVDSEAFSVVFPAGELRHPDGSHSILTLSNLGEPWN